MVKMEKDYLENLFSKIQKQKYKSIEESYTANLLQNPNVLSKKIGEESTEVIIEILNKDKTKLISESSDLLYHLMVSWIYLDIHPQDIWNELKKREKIQINNE